MTRPPTRRFESFHSQPWTDAEFDARPQVLMIGQYSTGKTSFIKYLLGRDFPGLRVGPEPTTDRFVAVIYGEEDRVIPGNALVVSPEARSRVLSVCHLFEACLASQRCRTAASSASAHAS